MKKEAIPLLIALVAPLLVPSCSMQRKIREIEQDSLSAKLAIPDEEPIGDKIGTSAVKKDTLQVVDLEGHQMLIMKAVRDDDGEMVATDILDAATVTARFRHVAERNGKVDIEFQVIVPEKLQHSKWQLRFYPDLFVMGDSTRLEPVLITGSEYRKGQLRGYQQYERFLSRIVADTTKFIDMFQLEIFIERNLPEVYAFKADSSYVTDEAFMSRFGVTEKDAVRHYTNKLRASMNNRRKARREKMYARYVPVPIVTDGLKLDTVMQAVNGDFIYNYRQTINTRPGLRKADVVLSGEIFEQDRKIYTIPASEPLTFYISSLSAFADETEKYLTKVIERRAEANTACYIDFHAADALIDENLANNREEIRRIKGNIASLLENREFDLDSIAVTASSSPEGSYSYNKALSQKRSESVAEYFHDYITAYRDSLEQSSMDEGLTYNLDGTYSEKKDTIPEVDFISKSIAENWEMLDSAIELDTVLTGLQKEAYREAAEIPDPDRREMRLQKETCYKYMREVLYPRLRTVRFDFHLHRKGMVKDTVHTTVIDTAYMNGVQAIRDRDYKTAIALLAPYRDYNAAVAYSAMGYNANALSILEHLERTAEVNYMLAVVYSRTGDVEKAVQCYLHSCEQNPAFVHRGKLDPEIAALIKAYSLNEE